MTAKQKAARAKFKAALAEAKKLRKKNCKLTQAQAVKQAFAIINEKERRNPIKKIKKTVTDSLAKFKKGFEKGYYGEDYGKKRRSRKVGAAPTKVKAKKSKRTSEMHTDTKSHNVNIRVVSGVPRPKKFIKIPLKEKSWFRKYVYGFYGKKGVQAANLMNNGFTRKELNDRLNMFFKIQHDKGYDSWNRGDSVDRERFRDMFLMDQIKKGQYIY